MLGDKIEKTGTGGQRMYSQAQSTNDERGEQGGERYVNPMKDNLEKTIPPHNGPLIDEMIVNAKPKIGTSVDDYYARKYPTEQNKMEKREADPVMGNGKPAADEK